MVLKKTSVSLKLPFLDISGEWEPQDREREAAWELYVELVTRVPIADLRDDEGVLREALTSIYSLFGTTREILRKYGPDIAKPQRDGQLSFGYLAVALLNGALRPLLAEWHPRLMAHEAARPAARSVAEHESAWESSAELRRQITMLRGALVEYVELLAEVTGAPSLLVAVEDHRRAEAGRR